MSRLHYIRPETLAEALDHLDRHGRRTKILAGGTDLVVDLRNGGVKPDFILDVSRLSEPKGIAVTAEGVSVGAGVTLAEIESSDLLGRHAPALRKCSFTFASRQVRNVATIGGNVAHCSPCGDTVPPLVVHEARAELASSRGRREVPVEDIASGPYACSLPPDELILRFILKPAARCDLCRLPEDRPPQGAGHCPDQRGGHGAAGAGRQALLLPLFPGLVHADAPPHAGSRTLPERAGAHRRTDLGGRPAAGGTRPSP